MPTGWSCRRPSIRETEAAEVAEAEPRQHEPPGRMHRARNGGSAHHVYTVRMPAKRLAELRAVAEQSGEQPSALMRRWVLQRLDVERAHQPELADVRRTLSEALHTLDQVARRTVGMSSGRSDTFGPGYRTDRERCRRTFTPPPSGQTDAIMWGRISDSPATSNHSVTLGATESETARRFGLADVRPRATVCHRRAGSVVGRRPAPCEHRDHCRCRGRGNMPFGARTATGGLVIAVAGVVLLLTVGAVFVALGWSATPPVRRVRPAAVGPADLFRWAPAGLHRLRDLDARRRPPAPRGQ